MTGQRQVYAATLYGPRVVATFWSSKVETREMATAEAVWLDLADQAQTALAVYDFICRHDGDEESLEAHTLDLRDMATGELVTRMRPSLADLQAARADAAPPPLPGTAFSWDQVSDQALIAELARRLAARRAA